MNKEQFWEIIDNINKSFADKNRESRRRLVVEALFQLTPEEILDWNLILTEYSNAAYRNDLWAASAALGAHYTDDGFAYFRFWLISCGKEVYMNAMREPDSLAAILLEGEKPNFERFGYVAYEAYEAKLSRIDPNCQDTIYDAFINCTLDTKTKKEIHAELPKRKDICAGWSEAELPDLFPNICKRFEPKDIAALISAGNIACGYVRENGQYTQYMFYSTAKNIANFIGGHPTATEITVTDNWDRLILNTIGTFIDRCPNKALLERVKKVLVPIQLGTAEAQPLFCPTRDEVDAYCKREKFLE